MTRVRYIKTSAWHVAGFNFAEVLMHLTRRRLAYS